MNKRVFFIYVITRQFTHTENVVCTGNCPNDAIRVPPSITTAVFHIHMEVIELPSTI